MIDVIISDHNYHHFVPEAVASVLAQRDISTRVVIVDDGSDEVLTAHPDWPEDRVRVIRRDERGGPAAAINTGLAVCSAEFVALLDADDLFPAHRSRVLLQAIGEADIAYGGQVVFDDGQNPELDLSEAQLAALPDVTPTCLSGTTLFRRRLFDRAGPLPESRAVATFIAWMVGVRRLDPPPVEVAVNSPVLLRRSHSSNMTRTSTGDFGDYIEAIARHRAPKP